MMREFQTMFQTSHKFRQYKSRYGIQKRKNILNSTNFPFIFSFLRDTSFNTYSTSFLSNPSPFSSKRLPRSWRLPQRHRAPRWSSPRAAHRPPALQRPGFGWTRCLCQRKGFWFWPKHVKILGTQKTGKRTHRPKPVVPCCLLKIRRVLSCLVLGVGWVRVQEKNGTKWFDRRLLFFQNGKINNIAQKASCSNFSRPSKVYQLRVIRLALAHPGPTLGMSKCSDRLPKCALSLSIRWR